MAIDVNFIRSKTRTEALVESMTSNKGGIYFPPDSGAIIMGGREYGQGASDILLQDITDGRIRNFSFDKNSIGEPRITGNVKTGYVIDYPKLVESGWEILGYQGSQINVGTNPRIDYVDKTCSGLPQFQGQSYLPHSERALKITLYDKTTSFGLYQTETLQFPEQGDYILVFDISCASGSLPRESSLGKARMFLVSQDEVPGGGTATVPYFGSEIFNFSVTPVWDTIYVPIKINTSELLSKQYTPMLVVDPGASGDYIILDHFRLFKTKFSEFTATISEIQGGTKKSGLATSEDLSSIIGDISSLGVGETVISKIQAAGNSITVTPSNVTGGTNYQFSQGGTVLATVFSPKVVYLTQQEYDALQVKDPYTEYNIYE